ncbi:hypothetical protein DL764_007515 [Monosporascus ibericus]|uniref:peptidyl-tRNA hydrolase n=1 Tax=Monosporascus ibericus TaxID=155417 RepID=A0A4Q4T2Y2_9PEZI|nr:hypothetical protein DL764_007515 [Monosporascus ibericus]
MTTMTTDATIIATSLVTFISGFMLGVYSIRGYLLVSPELADERRRNLHDPVESDESDVDEGDTVLDHAPNWANGVDADRRDGLRVAPDITPSGGGEGKTKKKKKSKKAAAEEAYPAVADVAAGAGGNTNEECKLVLVVRTDLGMTKGKIAAQCSHATLACYKTLSRSASSSLLRRWERHGQAKIAVQTKSEDEMLELMGRARSLGITAEVIQDAGRTQIDPGSLTVLGVGPAPKSLVDQVTGHLKLL